MKHITLLLLLVSSAAFSQLKEIEVEESELIGKVGPMGALHIQCERLDNTYTFTYADAKYQVLNEYKSFSFDDIDGAFEFLYTRIQEGLQSPPKDRVYIQLPEGFLFLDYVKALGTANVRLGHSLYDSGDVIGYSPWLTKKKVRKLFGKKK